MQRILILGAGTAGTMAANKLRERLDDEWDITIVDQDETHYYQPGFLFIPFGTYEPSDVVKTKREFIPAGVNYINASITELVPGDNTVMLGDGTELAYDHLVIATGTNPSPAETPGLETSEYGKTVHDFYTFDGAVALRDTLADFDGGTLAINIVEMPIKCPVAPLEFAFLAEAFFTNRGIRDKVDIVYVTPLDSAFTKPVAAKHLGSMFEDRGIAMEPDFYLERVDAEGKKHIVLRENIDQLIASRKSLMPDGFEKQVGKADILAPTFKIAGALPIQEIAIKLFAVALLPANSNLFDNSFQQSRIVMPGVVLRIGARRKQQQAGKKASKQDYLK